MLQKKQFFTYILPLFISLGIMSAGTFLPDLLVLTVLLSVISALPLIAILLNLILAKRFIAKVKGMNVAQGNAFLLSHRDDAEKTTKEKLQQLISIRRLTHAYTVMMLVASIGIALLGGLLAVEVPALVVFCVLYSWLVLASVATRIRTSKQIELTSDVAVLAKDEYPIIYQMARKAADTVGSKHEIVILPSWDFSASIIKDKNRYLLRIGVILLHVLSEQELYNIMLHEFAHVTSEKDVHFREEKYADWLGAEGGGTDPFSAFLSNFYLYFGAKYLFHYMIYRYACSVVYEQQADSAMAEHGDRKAAVSALLKTHYDTMFFWESGVNDEKSIFESEELKADYLSGRIALFKEAIASRSNDWNALVKTEILANNASHPTLKMRMDALGIQELVLVESQSSEQYLQEINRVLDYSEKFIYDERIKDYSEQRKQYYLDPLERINAWEQEGKPILAETYADLISDLKSLGRHRESEELCDRVIEQLPDSATHAIYIKGSMKLYRYDPSGMDMIYQAMERNGNYIEEGLDTIGSFCCLTGREEDLQEYRSKAKELAQKHLDQDEQISFLSKNDKLTRENLPDGMLEEILAFIKSIDQGIIQKIYLVRKTVSDSFFASVFVIQFYGGTDAQRNEIMHKIFRYLDSYHVEWQFSLFDYHDYLDVKVDKIEGSLVYSKQENTGE